MQSKRTEKALDLVLADALRTSVPFAAWFLAQTRFGNRSAECVFVRANNPWSSVFMQHPHAHTGIPAQRKFDCETDVLAVFATVEGRRLGIHIENKLAGGSFTELQPQLYGARVEQWKGRDKLGNYDEGTTVLVAPLSFLQRHAAQASAFDTQVSHEAIARELPSPAFVGAAGSP